MSNPNKFGRGVAVTTPSITVYKQEEAAQIIASGIKQVSGLPDGNYHIEVIMDREEGLTITVYKHEV